MARSRKPCSRPGCPNLVPPGTTRCPDCARAADKARGTRQQRGYDAAHERERKRVEALLPLPCARGCGRLVFPGMPWHLDHTDDRTGYLGPSCAPCNLSAAGKAAHR